MKLEAIKEALYDGGVAGAGGAGFPTHAKLSPQAETVILNCAECEPLIKVDRQLMTAYIRDIMGGMQMLVEAMEARDGILAIKKSYTAAIEAVNSCISEYDRLKLHILPDIYPAGDEVVLIYETTKKIVPQGKIPILVGCVVVNVETVLNAYKKVTEGRNVTSKFVTVAGLVNTPVTVEVPVGITVQDLLDLAGGPSEEEYVLLMGGPMTGRICTRYEVVTKTTKALLVLPPTAPPIRKRQNSSRINIRNAMSVCSQCSICTSLCPRNLLGQSIKPHEFMRSIANGTTYHVDAFLNSHFCCSCGLCELYSCHQDLSPRSLLDAYKAGLREKGVKIPDREGKGLPNALREERKVPEHRLIHRLGLHSFDVPAPLKQALAGREALAMQGKTALEGRQTGENAVHGWKEVQLLLRQNIGAPCVPNIQVGDTVNVGQEVAAPPEGALGIKLHASISGKVTAVTEQYIRIQA